MTRRKSEAAIGALKVGGGSFRRKTLHILLMASARDSSPPIKISQKEAERGRKCNYVAGLRKECAMASDYILSRSSTRDATAAAPACIASRTETEPLPSSNDGKANTSACCRYA